MQRTVTLGASSQSRSEASPWLPPSGTSCCDAIASPAMREYEDAVSLVSTTRWVTWWQAAGSSLVLWDHVTTFGEEVEFIWTRHNQCLRDWGVLAKRSQMIDSSTTRCPSVFQLQMWLIEVALLAMNGIVIKRVACIYNNDKRVLWALTTVGATLAIHSVIVNSLASGGRSVVERIQSVNLYEMCHILPPDALPAWHWTFALTMFAFDALVFGLSIYQGIRFACENRRMQRDGRKVAIIEHLWRTRRTLASILLRDSILFPVINLVFAMLLIFVWIEKLQPSWVAPIVIASSATIPTLGCRLLLNLRTAYYEPFREEYFQSQL
ncbi:hypothetical protein BKA70DRAFT_1444222 [Coprinopsis sp. MPI-PUGE-AT-0042]|nr:hypothetical protein BKA70DRAFT_1444222 [Coprinopsis sp. MPI-PUGE-AT-0042]